MSPHTPESLTVTMFGCESVGQCSRFSLEPLAELRTERELGAQNFHGNGDAVRQADAPIDGSDATGADLRVDPVTAFDLGADHVVEIQGRP